MVVDKKGQSGPLRVTWNVSGFGASNEAMLSKRVRNGVFVFGSSGRLERELHVIGRERLAI
jgi:hypothetical protein